MRDWDEEELREAAATLLELAARLVRAGREREPDPTCWVEPPTNLRCLLVDPGSARSRGHFYGAVKAAGFDPVAEAEGVERRAARCRLIRSMASDR